MKQPTAFGISLVNGVINLILAVLKLTVGFLSGSDSLISDGIHSVTDVFSTVVVMIGIKLSTRRSDRRHPYGYERMECVAAVILSVAVFATGVGIGVGGIKGILYGASASSISMGGAAIMTSLFAIAVKETMFRVSRSVARRTGSSALMADAWHQRTDSLSSVGSLIGVLGMCCGVPVIDTIAGIVIAALIVKAAIEIFSDAMCNMTDSACDESLQLEIAACVQSIDGVKALEEIKTRLFGNCVYAEVTVIVDGATSSLAAYDIVQTVTNAVCASFSVVKDCTVHIHPVN